MFSTKEVILVLITVIGALALFLETAGIITVNQLAVCCRLIHFSFSFSN